MRVPVQDLIDNGVDVAGILTEDFFNRFAAAHFVSNAKIYEGTYQFDEFDSRLEIKYQVLTPITFDIDPISPLRFATIWRGHLLGSHPSSSSELAQARQRPLAFVPPNIVLNCERIRFTFTVYDGHTSTVVFSVDFTWSLTARCAVLLVPVPTGAALRLEPIKIAFSRSPIQIGKDIRLALARVARTHRRRLASYRNSGVTSALAVRSRAKRFADPSDPVWCAKVEQLILFVINQVVDLNLARFLREWELPRALELVDGVRIVPSYIAATDDQIVVGGAVEYDPLKVSPVEERVSALLAEFQERYDHEFGRMSDDGLRRWKPQKSPTFAWLEESRERLESELVAAKRARRTALSRGSASLAIVSNDRLFDAFAKRYLKADVRRDWSKGFDHIVKAEAGWWFTISGAQARVISGGVDVTAKISVGGYLRGCIFNFDPKHFGDWLCIGICVELRPFPSPPGFRIQAFPKFQADGIHLRLKLLTRGISLRFCSGFPDWLNDLIGWITGMLTTPLIGAIAAIIALCDFKIINYPRYFPGTGLEWTPRFEPTPSNAGPYLCFNADPRFQ